MIWHPLILAVLALDWLASGFVLYGASAYVRVLIGWNPEAADLRQVALEGATEAASLATRYGVAMFLVASTLWVLAISLVLPIFVPGAMCGTGVMTAMGSLGTRALALRGVALVALWIWRTLDGINRAAPRPPAVPTVARWQLLAFPLLLLSVVWTSRALLHLDPQQPVSCCQAVYDTFRSTREATTLAGLSDDTWTAATIGLGLISALLAIVAHRRVTHRAHAGRLATLVLIAALVWVPVAAVTLVRTLAAYHYRVLHHHCPWCLFSPGHGAVGYPLYGALVVIGLEAFALLAAARIAARAPELASRSAWRQRWALRALLAALLLFAALTAGPALSWRITHGVWIHGA